MKHAAAAILVLACSPDRATGPAVVTEGGPRLAVASSTAPVVISQVYGGGGLATAPYRNDFVELFNRSQATVSLAGWSVQYASATGTGNFQAVALSGSIAPGQYVLIQLASNGTVGAALTPDIASTALNLSGSAGKVALASTSSGIGCNGFSTPCSAAQQALIVDLVGYGGANYYEGTAAAPVLSNGTAGLRRSNGCQDTNDNAADFQAVPPAPRNRATTPSPCPLQNAVTVTPATATVTEGGSQTFAAEERDGANNVVSTTFTWSTSDANVATVDAAGVATGVAAGMATITATAADGTKGSATVTVNAPPPPGTGDIVISQIYGGGGNNGATLRNDFIELFNRSANPVKLDGWSVQYGSAGASSFSAATPLSGTIQPGGYYLIQEAAGTGGTLDLPTPDAVGTLSMGGTGGKIALLNTTTLASTACPTGGSVMDLVPYGSTNCVSSAPAPSNTSAALRKGAGCVYNAAPGSDFAVGAPTPRNAASPKRACQAGVLDHVSLTGILTVLANGTSQLTAVPQDGLDGTVAGATVTWGTSDPGVATVDAAGLVTGVAPGSATITATAQAGGITKSASVQVTVTNPGINWIDVSSSSASFPPGFQTQLFATARESSGGPIVPATFTFESEDPGIATVMTVSNTAIITGVSSSVLKPGIKITATPTNGGTPYVFVARPVTIEDPVSAPLSIYAKNDEFGHATPASIDDLDDFLIVRPQYTLSYNASRGTPNWVAYEMDGTRQIGSEDRCNCFTADPLLPASKQIFTSDYTSGGYDRGHMVRSADRTAANVDNATTFYLTNIVPQTADQNQGVWAQFENALGDSARGGRAVYVITGPLYSRSKGLTFLKDSGKVAIPDSTWKVALIGPRNGGLPFVRGDVDDWSDLDGLTVMAVNMPNISGIRNDPWSKYLTTVDAIEFATGYDVLSLLPVAFQTALEAGDRAPVAAFAFAGATLEGSALTFDASASTDPDLGRTDLGRAEALTYAWHFSDGTTAAGKTVTKTFADNGGYTATLVVADAFGWEKSVTKSVVVGNVAPAAVLAATTPLAIVSGGSVSVEGSFSDPGADDPWQYAFDWGMGGAATGGTLAASGATASATQTYFGAGSYTITFTVTDKDGAAHAQTLAVTVARREIGAEITPEVINLQGKGDGSVTVALSSPSLDVGTIDLASVRIGGVGIDRTPDGSYRAALTPGKLVLHFDRSALIAAGALTSATTELEVLATLTSGVEVVARGTVSVR